MTIDLNFGPHADANGCPPLLLLDKKVLSNDHYNSIVNELAIPTSNVSFLINLIKKKKRLFLE